MEYLDGQLRAYPDIAFRMRTIERDGELRAKSGYSGVITIPVVVHVVYRTEAENLSDAQIRSQIRVLNEDFQRKNPDAASVDPMFGSAAGSPDIQFRLAELDPQGHPTTGITRTRTSQFSFFALDNEVKYSAMGGADAWPAGQYLNIWVCTLGGGMIGYAQFPGGRPETDGVVIHHAVFGAGGSAQAPFNLGRTTTHEVGHWLNLRHIWGDGGCEADDLVEDTPPASHAHTGCPRAGDDCGGPVMVSNFMDYTDDACMNFFTRGQSTRMRALFLPGGARESLLYSPGLLRGPGGELLTRTEPDGLQAASVGVDQARIEWRPVPGAAHYRVRIRLAGSGGSWSERQFSNAYVSLYKLRPCTEYELQVAAGLDTGPGAYSEALSFRTQGCDRMLAVSVGDSVPVLEAPQLLGPSEALLSWLPVPGASGYRVQVKAAGARSVRTLDSPEAEIRVGGLEAGMRYLYRVRAQFPGGAGRYSAAAAFGPASAGMASRMAAPAQDTLELAPAGPGRMQARAPAGWSGRMRIFVETAEGRPAKVFSPFVLSPGQPIQLDFSALPPGSYRVRMEDEDGFALAGACELR